MFKYLIKSAFLLILFASCEALKPKKVDRTIPMKGDERARKAVEEGRGMSIGDIVRRGKTTFQFSTSNPMWRASLETLDFIPLTTVDYSGGMIITDWYSDNTANNNESLKITVRFLSNEIRSDSLKIVVHKKNCKVSKDCGIALLPSNSKLNTELLSVILRKASLLEKNSKIKKKKEKK